MKKKALLITVILTGVMMFVEFVGGLITNSLALISDAAHMLTHFIALTISLFAAIIACRPATRETSFGFYRAEVLAALINGITLFAVTVMIFYEAWLRLRNPVHIAEIEMLIIAVAGLIVNLVTAGILNRARKDDLNVRSAFYHMLGDTVSSVAVIAGAIVIHYTGIVAVDPLLSVFICILIIYWGGKLMIESGRILMESAPKGMKPDLIAQTVIKEIPEVKGINHVHIWQITSNMYSMTAHVEILDCTVSETKEISNKINVVVKKNFGIGHTNLQFECYDDQKEVVHLHPHI